MLEDVLVSVLGRQEQLKTLVRGELERLVGKGYLEGNPEDLATEVLGKLEERAETARERTLPLLKGLGDSLRRALDIPSRAEILALTEALSRHASQSDGQDQTDLGA